VAGHFIILNKPKHKDRLIPFSHTLLNSAIALVALPICSFLPITFPCIKRSATPPVWYMYLLSMLELLSLSGHLLSLYVESVKDFLELMIMKAGEKKPYLKQESELTVISGVECG